MTPQEIFEAAEQKVKSHAYWFPTPYMCVCVLTTHTGINFLGQTEMLPCRSPALVGRDLSANELGKLKQHAYMDAINVLSRAESYLIAHLQKEEDV